MIDLSFVERTRGRLREIEQAFADPALASRPARRRGLTAEHARLRGLLQHAERYERLRREEDDTRQMLAEAGDDAELRDMAEADLARIAAERPAAERELKVALLPADPDETRDTLVEIRAGTGGEEAALFAADLYRMYTRYAESRGWRTSVIDASPSSVGGFKEIVFSVEGEAVYRRLRYESGGHRVQRVPATEAQGRIHTSAATVAVLAEADEIDEIEIKPEELRIDLYRASGPGGQKVNKTESAVRLTHLPTGIVVQSQDERSQVRNREKAMRVLRARILDRLRTDEAARQADQRRSQIGSGDRSERIRTYNFPQNRVTDHRINLTLHQLDRVMEGDLDGLLDALYAHDIDLQLRARTREG